MVGEGFASFKRDNKKPQNGTETLPKKQLASSPVILSVYVLGDYAVTLRKFTPNLAVANIAGKGGLFFDHRWAGFLTYPAYPKSM